MSTKEDTTFSVRTSVEEAKRAHDLFRKLSESKKDALSKALDLLESSLAIRALAPDYRSQIRSIEASLENIKNATISIVTSAQEERANDLAKLQEQLAAQSNIIKDLQYKNSCLESDNEAAREECKAANAALHEAEKAVEDVNKRASEQAKAYEQQIEDLRQRIQEQSEMIGIQRDQLTIFKTIRKNGPNRKEIGG